MWHVVIVGVAAVVVVGCAIVAITKHCSQQHHPHRAPIREINESEEDRVNWLGPCCYCDGAADKLNGLKLPCEHGINVIHHTCLAFMKDELRECFTPKMVCRKCMMTISKNPRRGSSEGLRNRTSILKKCVICYKEITNNPKTLECQHVVHETCWERIKETSTTCPECMNFDI